MDEFDLIVVGGGSGTKVADVAADQGLDVAVVEPGPFGGACLTRGCIPSKALLHRADVAECIQSSESLNISAEITDIDLGSMTNEINATVTEMAEEQESRLRESDSYTVYKTEGTFIDDRTLQVNDEQIRGEKVIVAAGLRSLIPPIDGIDAIDYLTSTEALRLDERPDHLLVIGGGYIAAEMSHLYGSLGVEITIISRSDALIDNQDDDISETFTSIFEGKYDVYTGYEATTVSQADGTIAVQAESADGNEIEVTGDELLVATGREPNTDTLAVENAGIETDDQGFVKTNEYLETTAENVWALGDIAGKPLFKHAADLEARYVATNALEDETQEVDYTGLSHAVFSSPQVAHLGKTEQELEESNTDYASGRYEYADAPMGMALKAEDGFVKVLADPEDGTILGCHILGPHASMLIHEVVGVVSNGGTTTDVTELIHVHPALNEVLRGAFEDVDTSDE